MRRPYEAMSERKKKEGRGGDNECFARHPHPCIGKGKREKGWKDVLRRDAPDARGHQYAE